MNCPHCKSANTKAIGFYSVRIAIDDAVEITQFICGSCDYEWEA